MKQLVIYSWLEYYEIGIIFRIIMNRKILAIYYNKACKASERDHLFRERAW